MGSIGSTQGVKVRARPPRKNSASSFQVQHPRDHRYASPTGDPGEQGQAQLTLKPLQLPTERGLHEIQADRGPRDRADLGHRDEGPEQFLLHAG